MINSTDASANMTGHSVISSSAMTTCSAVNKFTGGMDVGTVASTSDSRSSDTSTPGTPDTASSIIEPISPIIGSNRRSNCAAVELSSRAWPAIICARRALRSSAHSARVNSKLSLHAWSNPSSATIWPLASVTAVLMASSTAATPVAPTVMLPSALGRAALNSSAASPLPRTSWTGSGSWINSLTRQETSPNTVVSPARIANTTAKKLRIGESRSLHNARCVTSSRCSKTSVGEQMSEHTSGPPGPTQPQLAADTTADNPWPLSRLSDNLKHYIERVSPTWVEGQLIEHRVSLGHAWMTLRDIDVEMALPVVAWSRTAKTLDPSIKEGARVVALVKPNFYTKTGRLTMIVNDMRPVGIGELLARVEKLRRALAEEGLFAPELKKPLPVLPNRIGLITGKDSDAMHDVQRNVWLRWPAAEFEVIHAAMQGPQVGREVSQALQVLDQHPEVDVIVVARGGGALEEVILPFSDEALIRAVAGLTTPVVSAIGHEADRPVLDDVADFRASTPTDAAKTIVPDAAVEHAGISDARVRMAQAVQRLVDVPTHQMHQLRTRPRLGEPARKHTSLNWSH